MKKVIEIIKRKWLRDTLLTIILVAIIIMAFILINVLVQKQNIDPIDFTADKIYTLSDDSKDAVKSIDEEVKIYLFGYLEDDKVYTLAKQYENANSKITAEIIDLDVRQDIASNYNLTSSYVSSYPTVAVQGADRYKILTSSDFYTYDTTTYETIDVTEQKITNAIQDITSENKPSVYFLTGHGEYSISSQMVTLATLMQNEVNDVKELNLLQTSFPEDCDTLVIASPQSDLQDLEKEAINKYINNGGNILWLNNSTIDDVNFPNLQSILDLYGVSFGKGISFETDNSKMLLENSQLVIPEMSSNVITKDIYTATGVVLASPGKIIVSEDKLEELGVTLDSFLNTSETAYYREDFSNTTSSTLVKEANDEQGPFVVGAELDKKISDDVTSKLVVYANNFFASDSKIAIGNNETMIIGIYNNKDLLLNTVAYLTDREDSIRVRKNTGAVTYTATEQQNEIVKVVIFSIPVVIIVLGIVIWQIRRRKY